MFDGADLQLDFTDRLRSPTAYEALHRSALRPRLLCFSGLSTDPPLVPWLLRVLRGS